MHSTLTVTTPAESFALTRVDTVKAELGIAGTAEDSQIDAYIWQASSAITGYLGRVIAQEIVSEQFRLPRELACRTGIEQLVLSRYPVVSIDSVEVDGIALDEANYEVDRQTGLLTRLCSDSPTPWRGRKITVAYTGGYISLPELPDAIERACINLVKAYRSAATRDPLIRSESVDGVLSTTYWVGSTPGGSGGLPPDVTALLDPYRDVALG